jgi:hypothetical protein
MAMLPAEWHFQKMKVVGGVVVVLPSGRSRSSAVSGDQLTENELSVCGWLLKVGVTQTEGAVTDCLASPGHGVGGNHVG